jgi:hypothetical protein
VKRDGVKEGEIERRRKGGREGDTKIREHKGTREKRERGKKTGKEKWEGRKLGGGGK